jgi:hypothetical protein
MTTIATSPITRWALRGALAASCCALWLLPATAHAERATIGPHFGVNFDGDVVLIGVESRIDLGNAGRSVIVQLNPSFSYYAFDDALFNISLNVPFEFVIQDSVLRPFAAPGLAFFFGEHGHDLKLNLIGGLLFNLDGVEPFVQLRAAVIDGSFVDLMGGVLFRI